MIEVTQLTSELSDEVSKWTLCVLSGSEGTQAGAASELSRLGVWTRGTTRPRGTLSDAALNRLPHPEQMEQLVSAFVLSHDAAVRIQLALALGEWGDKTAARGLQEVLTASLNEKRITDESIQNACILALATIGGPDAVAGLGTALEVGSDNVRATAMAGVEELATGGRLEDTESSLLNISESAHPTGAVHGRPSALPHKTRQTDSAGTSDTAVTHALHGIADDVSKSDFLRLKARDLLAFLGS